jgi:mono/diheme cytochrome c family protein
MKILPKHIVVGHVVVVALVLLTLLVVARSGIYNFGADDPHWKPVYSSIDYIRKRSVLAHAADIKVPDLSNEARLVKGAGNYEAMCAQCHLSPGKSGTELSRGLYPSPPDLSKVAVDARQAFWTIKHGVKASGMPAWGKSMADEDIWNLVALIQKLPASKAESYRALVASSSGHSHTGSGGPDAPGMAHDDMEDHGKMESMPATSEAKPAAHQHKPGEEH